jgi:hypothetical protein
MNDDDEADIITLLSEILHWYEERNKPTQHRKYHACPVCYATWWDGGLFNREKHRNDCWVPELQSIVKNFQETR